jgi:RNA-splicing ligase RtcB
MEKTGEVKISLPHRKDAHIPLQREEAEKLVSKLNQLIPEAKQRQAERKIMEERTREIVEEDNDLRKESAQFPESPEEMHQEEKEIDEAIDKEENPD